MILGQLGLYAVAIPGANAWQGHHRRMLAGFSHIRIWADPDPAGVEFAGKIMQAMRNAKTVKLRSGDVSDTFMHEGAEGLLSLIQPVKEMR